jgi:hypothetical protein
MMSLLGIWWSCSCSAAVAAVLHVFAATMGLSTSRIRIGCEPPLRRCKMPQLRRGTMTARTAPRGPLQRTTLLTLDGDRSQIR